MRIDNYVAQPILAAAGFQAALAQNEFRSSLQKAAWKGACRQDGLQASKIISEISNAVR